MDERPELLRFHSKAVGPPTISCGVRTWLDGRRLSRPANVRLNVRNGRGAAERLISRLMAVLSRIRTSAARPRWSEEDQQPTAGTPGPPHGVALGWRRRCAAARAGPVLVRTRAQACPLPAPHESGGGGLAVRLNDEAVADGERPAGNGLGWANPVAPHRPGGRWARRTRRRVRRKEFEISKRLRLVGVIGQP